jgi:hypothetical protein
MKTAYRHPAQHVAADPKDMIPATDLNVKSVIAHPGEWATPGKPTKYGFRKWAFTWRAAEGQYTLMSRATNEAGQSQPLEPDWNPNGYLYNAAQGPKSGTEKWPGGRWISMSKLRAAAKGCAIPSRWWIRIGREAVHPASGSSESHGASGNPGGRRTVLLARQSVDRLRPQRWQAEQDLRGRRRGGPAG